MQNNTSWRLRLLLFMMTTMWMSVIKAQEARAQEAAQHHNRLGLGADFNVGIDMLGAHAVYEHNLASWSLGSFGLGALLGFHVYTTPDLGYVDTEVSRFRATTRLSLLLGHNLHLLGERLVIGTHTFMGPSLFTLTERYKNPTIELDEERSTASLFGEAGIMMSVGYRFGAQRRAGVSLEALMPLYVTGKTELLHMWFVSTPFFGVSAIWYH